MRIQAQVTFEGNSELNNRLIRKDSVVKYPDNPVLFLLNCLMKNLLATLLLSFTIFASYSQSQTLYQDVMSAFEKEDFQACADKEVEIEAFISSRQDTIAANLLAALGESFYQIGSLEKAVSCFEREEKSRIALNQKYTAPYSLVLYNLGTTWLELGNYQKAGTYATLLLENDKKMYPPSSEDYVASVISAAAIFIQLDRFDEAERLLAQTIRQQDKGSLFQGVLYTKLGDLYTQTSQFSKGGKALNSAVQILEAVAGKNSNEYNSAMIALGILHMGQGKLTDAEGIFETVLEQMTPGEPAYPALLNNQAIVYQYIGQHDRSEKLFRQILEIDSAAIGTSHPDYAVSLSNLGVLLSDEGKYKDAIAVLRKSLAIQKENGEEGTASYAFKLNNLARAYRMSGAAEQAVPLLEQALEIIKKTVGTSSAEYATMSFNLGMALWKAGKGPKGFKYLKSAVAIRAEKLGKKHPRYAEAVQKVAEYQWEQKQMKEAKISFNEVFENYHYQIEKNFPVLTEEEKAKFYYTNIKPSFEKFNAFAMAFRKEDPLIVGEIYNHHINTKAAIMYATEKVKEAIQKSNDTTLIRDFERWQAQKEQIAKLYSQNQAGSKIDSLQQSADRLEKDLTRKSSIFASQLARPKLTWQEVQKKLKPKEAAIEIIRYKDYTPAKGGDFKDNINYAFLIVTPDTKVSPEVLLAENGLDMEKKFLNYYRNNIKYTLEDNRSYKCFFSDLADVLTRKGIEKIYLSPDGVYNQINLNTIKNPATNKFMLDEFEIRLVTNTRELIEVRPSSSNSASALLIGFPKFNLDAVSESSGTQVTRSLSPSGTLSRGLRGGLLRQLRGDGGISVLPGTQVEINQIAKLTKDPEIFMEDLAAEGLIKQVISPMILHVATHGYFLDDENLPENPAEKSTYVPSPLLKSGLLLAGSENFLRDGTPANDAGDDGILTAYEAMNLKLEDTELVVLSACETGLGVVKNGEGVYGLQRAFKMAGAKNMIMSLWQVDDAATQQLMSTFYEEKTKHTDTPTAFRIAQQKLKEVYPHPFFWGAFIMVGI